MNECLVLSWPSSFFTHISSTTWYAHTMIPGSFPLKPYLLFLPHLRGDFIAFFFFFLFMPHGSWDLFPDQGLKLGPWQSECRAVTIGPPENFLQNLFNGQ